MYVTTTAHAIASGRLHVRRRSRPIPAARPRIPYSSTPPVTVFWPNVAACGHSLTPLYVPSTPDTNSSASASTHAIVAPVDRARDVTSRAAASGIAVGRALCRHPQRLVHALRLDQVESAEDFLRFGEGTIDGGDAAIADAHGARLALE